MAKGYKSTKVKYQKKKLANPKNAIIKLDDKVKKLNSKINGGITRPFVFELQIQRETLVRGWNRAICIAPNQLHVSGNAAQWKTVFETKQSPITLYQTPKGKIKGIKLIQHFNLKKVASETSVIPSTQPVVIHNYVVRLKQDAGAQWQVQSAGQYNANHLTQDVHYCILGGDASANIAANGMCFFLNKKCFTVLAQHHYTFAQFGQPMDATALVGGANPMTDLKRYQRTCIDYIPMDVTIKSAGQPLINTDLGWTGVTYANVPATDQLLCLTYVTQGNQENQYNVEHAASGLIYGSC